MEPLGPIYARAISRTDAFRRFQRALGDATLHLNTVAIGLEAIASDVSAAQKAANALNVGWRLPAGKKNAAKSASIVEPLAKPIRLPTEGTKLRDLTARSKVFVLRAVLVAACDCLDTYVAELVKTPWLKIDESTADICTKAVTKPGKIAWSLAERYTAICTALQIPSMEGRCAIVALGSRWRNALVHAEGAKFDLHSSDRQMLMSNADGLCKAGFIVTQALERFKNGSDPTLKDVTTIVSYSQELCATIDRYAIVRVMNHSSEVERFLLERLKMHFKSRGRVDDFWGIHRDQEWDMDKCAKVRPAERTERASAFDAKWHSRFGQLLDSLGFSASQHPVSGHLSAKEVGRLTSMSAKEFADELSLPNL